MVAGRSTSVSCKREGCVLCCHKPGKLDCLKYLRDAEKTHATVRRLRSEEKKWRASSTVLPDDFFGGGLISLLFYFNRIK